MAEAAATVPDDWYRYAYPPEMELLPWAQRTEGEVDRALTMLGPRTGARILDLGCGTGRHTIELAGRGFDMVGIELLEANVEVARAQAAKQGLDVEFVQADLRELDLNEEFDGVLSLNDGAIGYFESESENLRTFEVIANALRAGGRHLAQLANPLHAEAHMPSKGWIEGDHAVELFDHRWNPHTRCLEGITATLVIGEPFMGIRPIPFRKRLYSIEELAEIYAGQGMTVIETYRGSGKPGRPRPTQYEFFVVAGKSGPAASSAPPQTP